MAAAAAPASPRNVFRDPVLLVPLVVAAGLAVGWLGIHRNVAGSRQVADIALAWALITASTVVLERPRWRSTRILLSATAFALLAADLQWASSGAVDAIGRVFECVWPALLALMTLTFPEGRPWSPFALPAVGATCATTIGGELFGAVVAPAGVAVVLVVLALIANRARGLRAPAWRAQGPLLGGAALTALCVLVWLSWVIDGNGAATLQSVVRAGAVAVPLGVVVGIGWSRLGRPPASQIVVELREQGPTTMSERLARVLGDPTLDVAYRLADNRYVDATGAEIELPHERNRAVTPVMADGREIAALIHDPSLLDEPGLVESVRATAALVLENERLAAEVRAQLAEVRASRGRIVSAADGERRRIERNLHDGAQQRLVTLSVALGLEASRADAATADVLARAQDEVEEAITELRELARGIHPTLLRDEGLTAAVEALARRASLPVSVQSSVRGPLPDRVEIASYFVVAEALTNVAKHASATEAQVVLDRAPTTLRVTVRDDGVGGAFVASDSGLAGLRDRLEAVDALLTVESEPGAGTTVCALFPCAS